jgi:lipopolysaccharide biosynthesis protein
VAVVHCFYADIAEAILTRMADPGMAAAGAQFVLALTTDTEEKATTLRAMVARLGLTADVMVCPNRGRDVAPFLTACARHIDSTDLVLHLHTKKCPHSGGGLAGWGAFLLDNLIGTPEVVASILHLFDHEETGMVYSGHLRPIANVRNWGYDFPAARDLLARIGISISARSASKCVRWLPLPPRAHGIVAAAVACGSLPRRAGLRRWGRSSIRTLLTRRGRWSALTPRWSECLVGD